MAEVVVREATVLEPGLPGWASLEPVLGSCEATDAWGAALVDRDFGDGERVRYTLLARDAELFRSLRVICTDDREIPPALERALERTRYEYLPPGWPEEWSELWPELERDDAPIVRRLDGRR